MHDTYPVVRSWTQCVQPKPQHIVLATYFFDFASPLPLQAQCLHCTHGIDHLGENREMRRGSGGRNVTRETLGTERDLGADAASKLTAFAAIGAAAVADGCLSLLSALTS